MKKIVNTLLMALIAVLFTNCYDRDILDSKEFNHSLPKVENLSCVKTGNMVKLTWQFPSNISTDFKRPLEVSIQVVENDIYRQKEVVVGEKTSTEITIDASKEYRFVVKLLGYLTDDVREKGRSDKVYSDPLVVDGK